MRARISRIFLNILVLIVALLVMVNLHEIGHTLAARLLGDPQSHYVLYQSEGYHTCLGCNFFDASRLSEAGILVVSASGLGITQVGVLLLLQLHAWARRPVLRRILGASTLVFLIDLPLQVGQGVFRYTPAQHALSNVDLADVIYLLVKGTQASPEAIKVVMVGAAMGYLVWVLGLLRAGARNGG